MAVVASTPTSLKKLSEARIQYALTQYFDWYKNKVIPNSCVFGWEADLLVVTGAGVIIEVEVKTSLADWRADELKDKWTKHDRSKIGRMFYAVPEELIARCPEFVKPEVGLLGIYQDHAGHARVRLHRPPALVSKHRVTEAEMARMLQTFYYRFWPMWNRTHKFEAEGMPWPPPSEPSSEISSLTS